ncbi:hypothetical protein MMC16_005936 [Acarospora aff. strigata]|nr:hypothetical protein [Acarospora aff. strigata]
MLSRRLDPNLSPSPEVSPGIIAVNAGNFSIRMNNSGSGSWQVRKVDLMGERPKTDQVVAIPEVELFNGMTTWDKETILDVDSVAGVVYKINIRTGKYTVTMSDPDTTAEKGGLGINGIKIHDGFVYYTSSDRRLFCRIPVDHNASPTGSAQVIASGFGQDDFDIDADGRAYIVTDGQNSVVRVSPSGQITTVAGGANSLDLAGGTACHFGKTDKYGMTLYVTTSGAIFEPINGTVTEPAKVAALSLSGIVNAHDRAVFLVFSSQ